MKDDDLKTALEYCREWNTNAKHCHAAQALLAAILRSHKPDKVLKVQGALAHVLLIVLLPGHCIGPGKVPSLQAQRAAFTCCPIHPSIYPPMHAQ